MSSGAQAELRSELLIDIADGESRHAGLLEPDGLTAMLALLAELVVVDLKGEPWLRSDLVTSG
jgi:hypothetical protein